MSGVAHISAQTGKLVASFRLQMALLAPLSRAFYEKTEMGRAFHYLTQLDRLVASFRLQMTLLAPWRKREMGRAFHIFTQVDKLIASFARKLLPCRQSFSHSWRNKQKKPKCVARSISSLNCTHLNPILQPNDNNTQQHPRKGRNNGGRSNCAIPRKQGVRLCVACT